MKHSSQVFFQVAFLCMAFSANAQESYYSNTDPADDRHSLDDYAAQKYAFREINRAVLAAFLENVARDESLLNMARKLDLYPCTWPEAYLVGETRLVSRLSHLALFAGYVEGHLEAYRIPPAIYSPKISDLETQAFSKLDLTEEGFLQWLEGASDEFGESLVVYLQEHASQSSPIISDVTFQYFGGCGAGEATFTIQASPPNAAILLVPRWNYLYCTALRKNPFSATNTCAGKLLAPPTLVAVIGSYNYRATWPDGRQTEGYIDFGTGSGELVTITPRGYSIQYTGMRR